MIWSMYQSGALPRVAATAERAATAADSAKSQVDRDRRFLEDKIDTLALVCQAMWSLLQEKCGLTEKELMARMEQLDLEDGKRDHKRRRATRRCTNCGRALNERHAVCLYCGTPVTYSSAFETV